MAESLRVDAAMEGEAACRGSGVYTRLVEGGEGEMGRPGHGAETFLSSRALHNTHYKSTCNTKTGTRLRLRV